MEVEFGTAIGAVGGGILTLVVTKLMNRTAKSISDLPELEWRVRKIEDARAELKADSQLKALWRELAKAKTWIDDSIQIARSKGIELTQPKWGPEP